jgi:hypothetical protein
MRPEKSCEMVSRREVLVWILAASAVAVGAVAFSSRRKGGTHTTTTTTVSDLTSSGGSAIFGAMHFPTTLESPAFSDAKADNLFTDMLAAMGVQMVAFEWDYQVFSDSRWNGRLLSAYAYARSKGMKTHIINQMQPAFWQQGGINPAPAASTPNSIDSYEVEITSAYAKLKPDYLSVLAEPANLQQKFKFSYSNSQWTSLVRQLVDQVPTPGTSTWVDLVPNSGLDLNLIPSLVGVAGLDGIGMDLYGQPQESVVAGRLPAIAKAGKSWGISETWWGPLYSDPSLNTAQNEPQMGSWLSDSYRWAAKNGAVMYNPFFTNLFVQEPRKVSYDYSGLTEYFSEELSLLESGSVTSIHDAYATLIASVG